MVKSCENVLLDWCGGDISATCKYLVNNLSCNEFFDACSLERLLLIYITYINFSYFACHFHKDFIMVDS